MKAPFVLHSSIGVSSDTIECLEALLKQARAGEVIGVAYCAMHKKRRYNVHSCGEAYRNPTFTRGMLAALDDELSQRIQGNT
jgi:hypothetical protein